MTELISLRKTFGETLEKLGGKQKNLIVLDSDLGNSLYSLNFAKSFPERHFTIGLAENSMLGMAAGMAVRKKIPFVCGETSALLSKGIDSLRNAICYPNLNIKIIGSHSEVTNSAEGTPRESVDDIAILRTLPNLKILVPADSVELKSMLEFLLTDYGPTFLRIPQIALPNIFEPSYQFKLGEPVTVREGSQVTIFSCGAALHEVLKTAAELENRAISTQVISLSSLTNLNTDKIIQLCTNAAMIVTVEQHVEHGGIGSMITDILNTHTPRATAPSQIIKIALSHAPESTSYGAALNQSGLSSRHIYEIIRENWLKH